MCEECYHSICPPSCPGYDGRSPEFGAPDKVCAVCGRPICEDEEFLVSEERCCCRECVENLDRDELLELCGLDDMYELLFELGFYEGNRN